MNWFGIISQESILTVNPESIKFNKFRVGTKSAWKQGRQKNNSSAEEERLKCTTILLTESTQFWKGLDLFVISDVYFLNPVQYQDKNEIPKSLDKEAWQVGEKCGLHIDSLCSSFSQTCNTCEYIQMWLHTATRVSPRSRWGCDKSWLNKHEIKRRWTTCTMSFCWKDHSHSHTNQCITMIKNEVVIPPRKYI